MPGSEGTCSVVAPGAPGNPSCAPYLCSGVPASCTGDGDCAKGYHCGAGACVPGGTGSQCLSGFCVSGICSPSGTCIDGLRNQDETDVDCGGSVCGPCNNGQDCLLGADCASGNCPADDLVCCNEPCSLLCQACLAVKTGSPDGMCDVVPDHYDPDGDCGWCHYCYTFFDVPGCMGPTGCSCVSDAECLFMPNPPGEGDFCVDGYCCDGPCTGACEVCDSAGSETICTPVPFGWSGNPSCAPYVCNGVCGACPTSCTGDANCATGNYCLAGSCVPKQADGAPCAATGECASGYCADGVCCDTACGGPCVACTAVDTGGTDGSCGFVLAGTDPAGECVMGQTCNGSGTCN